MNPAINPLYAERLAELAALITHCSSEDGLHPTVIPGVLGIRLSAPHLQLPAVYRPSICVIVQGAKQVLLEQEVYRYAPSQFLAVSVDLPLVGQVLEATAAKPYLCLAIDLDGGQIADLLTHTPLPATPAAARGLFVGDLDEATLDSVLRLARLLRCPREVPVLAPLLLRELHYRILAGPAGAAIAQRVMAGSATCRIGQAIHRIKSRLAEPMRVTELAAQVHLSRSAFHEQFKAVTAMSPLQFQKRLRLTEARQILLSEQADAASTAYRVGYQSVSQFSREYARLFGAPPKRDVAGLRHGMSRSAPPGTEPTPPH